MTSVDATLVGIYRNRNSEYVERLIAPALEHGWQVAWWALDTVIPDLQSVTVGEGPGEKLPLLNRLLDTLDGTPEWTVLSDDDLVFPHGNVVDLVELAARLGFDLAQPARERGTHVSHLVTERVRLSRARLTTFVESGPMVLVGPRWRDRILPLPADRGMGWGVEYDWWDLYVRGCRLGILDAMPVIHVGTPMQDYDWREMNRRLKQEAAEKGHPHWEAVETWRPWQKQPPWQA